MWDYCQYAFVLVVVILNHIIPSGFLVNINFIFNRNNYKLRYFMQDCNQYQLLFFNRGGHDHISLCAFVPIVDFLDYGYCEPHY